MIKSKLVDFMKILSPAFGHNQFIPSRYTCEGEDINPPLIFEEVPEAAESLVLIVDDPDAPGGDWVHWTLWNISPEIKEIKEDSVPSGAQEGLTDFGHSGYGGPCPPSGIHRYYFKLYALDTRLDLDPSAKKADIIRATTGHIIDKAILIGLYEKKN